MNHERIRILLQEAEKCLRIYQNELAKDKPIDMSLFEQIVQDFCNELSVLPKEEAQIYQDNLGALGQALEALSDILVEKRNGLKQQITNLATSSKAHNAYQNPGAT